MADINRQINISAKDDGFSRVVSGLGEQLNQAFEGANLAIERMTGNTADFADVLAGRMAAVDQSISTVSENLMQKAKASTSSISERLEFIKKELSVSERQLKVDTERQRLSEKQRYRNALADSGSPEERREATREYRENMASIEEDARVRRLQLAGVRERTVGAPQDEEIKTGLWNWLKNPTAKDGDDERQSSRSNSGGGMIGNIGKSLLSGFGVLSLLSVGGFIGKMINEGIQLDEAESSTNGLGMRGVGSGSQYGKKRADLLGYSRNVALAAGSGQYDAVGNLATEKSFSLGEGELLGLTKALRTSGGGDAKSSVLEMLSIFKKSDLFNIRRGDFTQLSEKIQMSTTMLEQQGGQMMVTSSATTAQIIAALGSGGFKDQRASGIADSINNSITNPNNDFSKAFLFRSIRKRDPNASLLDVLMKQEQGIYGQGTAGGIMDDLKSTFSGDQLTMSVAKMFGVKNFQAKQLLDNGADFSRIGSDAGLSESDRVGLGKGSAGVMSRRMAQMDDWFAGKGEVAVRKVDEYVSEFEKNGVGGLLTKMSSDVVTAIKEGFSQAAAGMKEWMKSPEADVTKGAFLGGGVKDFFTPDSVTQGKKLNRLLGFNYNNKGEAPQLNQYYGAGDNSLNVEGRDFSGVFNGKTVKIEGIKREEVMEMISGDILKIFAYAMEHGMSKLSKEQAKEIIEQGFKPQTETLKQLHIQMRNDKSNTLYSTE